MKVKINKSISENNIIGDVKIGIRPENFFREPKDKNNTKIIGKINVIEPMGSETYIYLESTTKQLVARVKADDSYKIGEEISLWVSPDHIRFFNAKSGMKISID